MEQSNACFKTLYISAYCALCHNSKWKPVAYHSRSMFDAEKRYPQIDKEALAVTYTCERFSDLPIGMYFKIETDHKPLVALLGKKDLDVLPPRVQRFRMYFMRYDYTIAYVQRKEHVSADALSGAPVDEEDPTLHEVSQAFVN